MRKLIRLIQDGTLSFEPEGSSLDDLLLFQRTAKNLERAYSLGFISSLIPHFSDDHGSQLIDAIVVGEITEKGKLFLSAS